MPMNEGKILALDWGDVRCGWALSDASQILASRHDVYYRDTLEADLEFFSEIIEMQEVVEVVIGMPYNMDGSIGPQAEVTLEFKAKLETHLNIPVYDIDERLTSAEAERVMLEANLSRQKRKENRDALAASIILQTYLDKKKRQA